MKPSKLVLVLVISWVALAAVAQAFAQPRRGSPRTITSFTDVVWSVKFSPDNRLLAIARGSADGGRVELWDLETGTLRHAIRGFDGPVWSISFAPDGKTLVTGSGGLHSNKIQEKLARRNGTPFVELKWWDLETGELKQRVELPGEDRISLTAAYSPDGKSLATIEYRSVLFSDIFGSRSRVNAFASFIFLRCGPAPTGREDRRNYIEA
jgi:Tol biopolymer transport system component